MMQVAIRHPSGTLGEGRDPKAFTFGLWTACLIHEDSGAIEHALSNQLLKYSAAICGRLDQADWDREGIEPAFPPGWNHAIKVLPSSMSREETESITSKVSHHMAGRSFLTDSPKEVAANLQDYVDAGANWISVGLLPGRL